MTLEQKLTNWTKPSSDSEEEKQERTERMISDALKRHTAFDNCRYTVFAKGSYKNNTNVRLDSDVDIAVQCHEVIYNGGAAPTGGETYTGIWTPTYLREQVVAALRAQFGSDVDTSGNTAIGVNASTARVDADVTPCFNYRHYFESGRYREGVNIFKQLGPAVQNYPVQHYKKGVAKNSATSRRFKQMVRILKNAENEMVKDGYHPEVPSYFIECLAYNCPNTCFNGASWTARLKSVLAHIYNELEGLEPTEEPKRWLEVNECKFLFVDHKWTRAQARSFASAVWNYLDLANA